MRFGLMAIVCATFWFASPCHAAANHPCIVKATGAIPHTVGLVIKQTARAPGGQSERVEFDAPIKRRFRDLVYIIA